MIRYTEEGITRDLEAGKRVVIVAPNHAEAQRAFQSLTGTPEAWKTIRRTSGDHQATHSSGGRLWARSARGTGLRGVTADVFVVLDRDNCPDSILTDLTPNLAPGGELQDAT